MFEKNKIKNDRTPFDIIYNKNAAKKRCTYVFLSLSLSLHPSLSIFICLFSLYHSDFYNMDDDDVYDVYEIYTLNFSLRLFRRAFSFGASFDLLRPYTVFLISYSLVAHQLRLKDNQEKKSRNPNFCVWVFLPYTYNQSERRID